MNKAAEYLSKRKWGVFTHYLYSIVCNTEHVSNMNTGITDWNEAVNRVDVERLAYRLHRMNVGYYFITLLQGTKYMIAPNATFDSIAGTAPGEACATRDLPMELAEALRKYDIDLCLYYTGDGPWMDEVIGKKFGFTAPRENISEDFVKKWASVLEEYALRYGDRVKAWWIDGCYSESAPHRSERFGYTDTLLDNYYNAVKKGNPNAAVTFNDGVYSLPVKYYYREDYTAGECRGMCLKHPNSKYIDGSLNHVLFPLGVNSEFTGGAWAKSGTKYTKETLLAYIKRVGEIGGVVTVDIAPFIDGSFDPEQEAILRFVGENIDPK